MKVFLLKGTEGVIGWAFGTDDHDRVLLLVEEHIDQEYIWTTPELLEEYGGVATELSETDFDSQGPSEVWQKLEQILHEMADESVNLWVEVETSMRNAFASESEPSVRGS